MEGVHDMGEEVGARVYADLGEVPLEKKIDYSFWVPLKIWCVSLEALSTKTLSTY